MPYVKPDAVVEQMVQVGAQKSRLPVQDLLVRGFLSGAFLGFATTLAFTATIQTRVGLVGALVFPVGFVMIVLLGLELVTGNFALVPLAVREGRTSLRALLANWGWVFLGNLIGSAFYALLFTATLQPDSEMCRDRRRSRSVGRCMERCRIVRESLVSFVGAGPGDPELITLKGLRRLREAEVVLHDRLAPPELLDEIAPGTTVVDVGKAPGRPCLGQGHINWLLVDWARRRGRVVRLKGGDPAIFGRLGEEIEAVRSAGIAFEVVPGVTAATAAAARAGISLTARGRASMLVLATGTDHTGRAPMALDWDILARVEGTLVFYMPVGSLEAITASLTARGRDRREPAILIERVGMPDERVISGRLGGIADEARAAGLASPAVLVTGPTVASASVPLGVRRMLAGAGV